MFLFAVRLLQTVRKGKIVLLRKPPNLAARTMCLSFGNVKTKLRINAFYGAVHIPCSSFATAKKTRPRFVGSRFFCCGGGEGIRKEREAQRNSEDVR